MPDKEKNSDASMPSKSPVEMINELFHMIPDVKARMGFENLFVQILADPAAALQMLPEQINIPKQLIKDVQERSEEVPNLGAYNLGAALNLLYDEIYTENVDSKNETGYFLIDDNGVRKQFTGTNKTFEIVMQDAVCYYFAASDNVSPFEPNNLTEKNKKDIVDTFYKIITFLIENNVTDEQSEFELFKTFIENENTAGENPQEVTQSQHAQYKKFSKLSTITDKFANVFFSSKAPAATHGAISTKTENMIPLRYESKKSKKEITLFYDYTYNEDVLNQYSLPKVFDDFDYMVAMVSDNLLAAGNDLVSFTKFFSEMGGTGTPGTKQLEQIYGSLLKGLSTIMIVNDEEVKKAWEKENVGTYKEIISPVIPVQIINERFIANGRIANCYIKINGYSPFWQVGYPLNRISEWDKDVLKLYTGRRTKRYYSVMRYLLQQIGWMRNGTRSNKIVYASLYTYAGDTTTRAQQLTRDMLYRLLEDVFKPTGYVKAYKEESDNEPGVVLTIEQKQLKRQTKPKELQHSNSELV